jgi:hypothetical protein
VTDQPKPDIPVEINTAKPMSAAEQRAFAHRANAIMEVVKLTREVQAVEARRGVPSAVDSVQLMLEIKQLQYGLAALVDILFAAALVTTVPNPNAPPDDPNAAPALGIHPFNRENYYQVVAAKAELDLSLMRRALLSVGGGAGILRGPTKGN